MSAVVLPASRGDVELALGRPELPLRLGEPLARLAGRRVLVTGAAGSVGGALADLVAEVADVVWTDVDQMDVRDPARVRRVLGAFRPQVVLHLAGAKHAPAGEEDPYQATLVNVVGTRNVLEFAPRGCRVVTASTCKSANPETAYGATKLIAERLTLNAGHSVARFYNVVETQGNVFEIWARIPEPDPLPVTPCRRYFVSLREAAGLALWAAVLPPARYTLEPGEPREMAAVAAALYPGRETRRLEPRRGDRVAEPRVGLHEALLPSPVEWLAEVRSPHDPLYAGEIPAA